MISYILKSIICAAVLIAFYGIFLLPEKMNRFKRGYLLAALFSSFLIPILPIALNLIPTDLSIGLGPSANQAFQNVATLSPASQQITWGQNAGAIMPTGTQLLIWIYGLITSIILFRHLWQVVRFWHLISRLPQEQQDGIRLILLPQGNLSFSFMRYICIAPTDLDPATRMPLKQIYLHELAHARGRHSLDILFITLLQALFWWNPFILLYKRAIQLNHEFLADEFVLKANGQTTHYQALLLSRIKAKPVMPLASTSIFSLTKKRFEMMTHHTPKRKIRLLQAAGVCVAGLCMLVLSQHTVAQDTAHLQKAKTENKSQGLKPSATKQKGISPEALKNYQREIAAHRVIKGKDTSWHFLRSEDKKFRELTTVYQSMSPQQQKQVGRFPPPPPPPPPARTKKGAMKAPPPPPPPVDIKKAKGMVADVVAPSAPKAVSAIKTVKPLSAIKPVAAVQPVMPRTDPLSPALPPTTTKQ